jgi:hypothetical protein
MGETNGYRNVKGVDKVHRVLTVNIRLILLSPLLIFSTHAEKYWPQFKFMFHCFLGHEVASPCPYIT